MSIHDECTGYDLAAGTATGLRSFAVDSLGRLRGVHYPAIWKPGENVAKCGSNEGRCDVADHGCGFWAFHDGSTYSGGQIHAVVEGYGKTTIGTKGFRAEKARIVALCLRDEDTGRSRWDRFSLWAYKFGGSITGLGLVGACASLGISAAALAGDAATWLLALTIPALIICATFVRAAFHGIDVYYDGNPYLPNPVSAEQAARVRRNYPDVKVYSSVDAMKKAHPVDPELQPTPETDPNFWVDNAPAPTPAAYGGIVSHADALSQYMRRNSSGGVA